MTSATTRKETPKSAQQILDLSGCSAPASRSLDVVCQEVVDIEAGTADGWFLIEAGVRTMPVVTVGPGLEFVAALD